MNLKNLSQSSQCSVYVEGVSIAKLYLCSYGVHCTYTRTIANFTLVVMVYTVHILRPLQTLTSQLWCTLYIYSDHCKLNLHSYGVHCTYTQTIAYCTFVVMVYTVHILRPLHTVPSYLWCTLFIYSDHCILYLRSYGVHCIIYSDHCKTEKNSCLAHFSAASKLYEGRRQSNLY